MKKHEQSALSTSLNEALNDYMRTLNGQPCTRLYQATWSIVEKQLLIFALDKCGGNISATAKMLGISRTTLTRKIAAHALRVK